MRRIKNAHTEPEKLLRAALTRAGYRYRLQFKTPGGKADLVILKPRFALFIDGCFWHGCPEHYVHPRTRHEFWDSKLRENVERDRRQTRALKAAGWSGLRVWEHEVREDVDALVARIIRLLSGGRQTQPLWRVVKVTPLNDGTDREVRHHEALLDERRTKDVVRVRVTKKLGRVRTARVTAVEGGNERNAVDA